MYSFWVICWDTWGWFPNRFYNLFVCSNTSLTPYQQCSMRILLFHLNHWVVRYSWTELLMPQSIIDAVYQKILSVKRCRYSPFTFPHYIKQSLVSFAISDNYLVLGLPSSDEEAYINEGECINLKDSSIARMKEHLSNQLIRIIMHPSILIPILQSQSHLLEIIFFKILFLQLTAPIITFYFYP